MDLRNWEKTLMPKGSVLDRNSHQRSLLERGPLCVPILADRGPLKGLISQ